MKKIEEGFNKLIGIEITFSILYTLLGILIYIKSEMTNSIVGTMIGTFFLLAGMIKIFTFIDKNKITLFKYNLFFGIISIILGIMIMLNPMSIINILSIGLGIWILIEGINKIVYFLFLKKVKERSSILILVSSLLFIFLGIVLIIYPFRSMIITKAVGAFIVLYNVLNLNDLILLKRRGKEFLKFFK